MERVSWKESKHGSVTETTIEPDCLGLSSYDDQLDARQTSAKEPGF